MKKLALALTAVLLLAACTTPDSPVEDEEPLPPGRGNPDDRGSLGVSSNIFQGIAFF